MIQYSANLGRALMDDIEEWKVIPSFPDYAASSFGNIRRINPTSHGRVHKRLLTGTIIPAGYRQVAVYRDGRAFVRMVHRLVCEAFHGTPPTSEHHAAHGDGNSLNNAPSNLRWATASENEADKAIHGTKACGEKQGASKLTERDVQSIRIDERSQREIASDYGITQANVSCIKLKKSWAHVS